MLNRIASRLSLGFTVGTTMTLLGVAAALLTIYAGLLFNGSAETINYSSPWHYKCEGGLCKKKEITPQVETPLPLSVCQLFCGEAGGIWPIPTGHLSLGNFMVHLNPENIKLFAVNNLKPEIANLLEANVKLLKENIYGLTKRSIKSGGKNLNIQISISNGLELSIEQLALTSNENYTLEIRQANEKSVEALIAAQSYFGARHALETLSQLIVFNDLRNEVEIVRDVYINDGPVYSYRGILLDTSRNFVDKATILRTIKAMSMSKMNTLHWHITDSHSFPYVSNTYPKFATYGAYSSEQVYTKADIQEIIEYGIVHGVRILPEFDAPAHVGEGWQWVGDDSVLCFKAEPWKNYCVEPPCGQLNPASEKVYEILGGLYKEMLEDFKPDMFHMGGDEVNLGCWNSTEHSNTLKSWMLQNRYDFTESGFYKVWDYFQSKALEKLINANNNKNITAILWTSGLTSEENIQYLNPDKYIIQIWTTGTDPTVARLLKNNFRIIVSNYDALYFDCGFGAWVGEGNNWCSPYIGWQKVYDNSPRKIVTLHGYAGKENLIIGGEAALWTEQADSTSIDSRLWPRGAALAERLWSEPASSWIAAEHRMLLHRQRLVNRGILADTLEPQWCSQNQGHCYSN